MPFSECGPICNRILNVEESVVTWDSNYKIPLMILAIVKMALINKILIVSLASLIGSLLFRELNNFSIIFHICWTNLLNQLLDIFMCFLGLFQGIVGKL